ncbi:MAG: hypothetical protein H6832_00160 [Planctomycetes bacterium]|nr:hypothetical protein [Planctomycetota bacterium]MCB9916795.1 hypothetical protein [Planctomycetota bacterium]
MRIAISLSCSIALAAVGPLAHAENLGGGRAAATGEFPLLVLDNWIPGKASTFRFDNLPNNTVLSALLLSSGPGNTTFGTAGTLKIDLLSPAFSILPVPAGGLTVNPLPKSLEGAELYFQGLWFEARTGLALTDGTRASLFSPLAMAGNSRQSANSLTVIDVASRSVPQTLTNSENGYIEFSPDRSRAYVCEPGAGRNRVVCYDLTKTPIPVLATIPVSGGIRYGGSMPRDGKRLYVPVHDGVEIVDTDPASSTYHTVLRKLTTSITGNTGSIFTGPLHTAVTPDGSKLYVACGENQTQWPSMGTVLMFDLRIANPTEKQIAVTNGGIFSFFSFNFATRPYIEMSPDGLTVYVLETGTAVSSLGFQNGSLINVIDTARDREIATLTTGGFYQEQIAIDRMGRGLWVAQVDASGVGDLARFDVDVRSPNRFQTVQHFAVGTGAFQVGSGPSGVDVTADGSTVFVSIVENASNPAAVHVFDARTGRFETTTIPTQSLCHTVSIQKD